MMLLAQPSLLRQEQKKKQFLLIKPWIFIRSNFMEIWPTNEHGQNSKIGIRHVL